jgi:hypothetical protein
MRRLATTVMLLATVYVAGYVAMRVTHAAPWAGDGHSYVIFPDDEIGHALYLLWRPLSRLDERLTGMRTHIGPHR